MILAEAGTLHTPEYAAVVSRAEPGLSDDVVERRVRLGMERQRARAEVTVILGEGALSLVVGSPDILTAQLDYLRSADAHPNIRARVLPSEWAHTPGEARSRSWSSTTTKTRRSCTSKDPGSKVPRQAR